MIVALGLPFNAATIILGCIFLILSKVLGPIRIPTPLIMVLTEIFHADAKTNLHRLPVSWYFKSLLLIYQCFSMHIMSMLWTIAEAVDSTGWPILFKVLNLNVVICIVPLHFSNIVTYSQLMPCAKWVKWTSNVRNNRTWESRNSKTRNDFLLRYETFLLTLS